MRERVIELLQDIDHYPEKTCPKYESGEECGDCQYKLDTAMGCDIYARKADYLIKKGLIYPPCKVGDTVYEVLPKVGFIRSNKVVGFHLGKFPNVRGHKRKEYLVCYADYSLTHIDIDKFGKTVFLTKEETEQALKERGSK